MQIELQAVHLVLKKWKRNPAASRRQIGIRWDWMQEREENNHSLPEVEVKRMKEFLRKTAPTSYFEIFPEEISGP